jgi:Polyketide cyclase / dehydrase and lipid transport
MPIIHETIETNLGIDDSFAYIADFANAADWDPGTATSERITPDGPDLTPVGLGSRYRLGVRIGRRVAPMDYRITTFEAPRRVVLSGSGSGVQALDDISFAPTAAGTRIEYVADIRLTGWLRLVEPLLGRVFTGIGRAARHGMARTLDERARLDARAERGS